MPNTKRDRSLVAGLQDHEIETVQKHYKISKKDLRAIIKECGHDRDNLYKIIEERGYQKKEQEQTK